MPVIVSPNPASAPHPGTTLDSLLDEGIGAIPVAPPTVNTLTGTAPIAPTTTAGAALAPLPPTALVAEAITDTSVTISWSSGGFGTPPVYFQVQFQVVGDLTWTDFAAPTLIAGTLTVTGLSASVNYLLRVTATNAVDSAASAPLAVQTAASATGGSGTQTSSSAGPVLSGPQTVSLDQGTAIRIVNLTLTDAAQASTPGAMLLSVNAGAGTVSMADANGLLPGSGTAAMAYVGTLAAVQAALATLRYTARPLAGTDTLTVTVADQFAVSASCVITVSILPVGTAAPVLPSAVTGLAVIAGTTSSITLSWTPSTTGSAPITDQVQYRRSGDTTWIPFGVPALPSTQPATATVINLSASQPYDFQIVARNAAGAVPCESVSATTAAGLVITVAPTVGGAQAVGSSLPILTGPLTATVGQGASVAITGLGVTDAAATVSGSQNTGTTPPVVSGPASGTALSGATLAVTGITIVDAAASANPGAMACNITAAQGSVAVQFDGAPADGSGTGYILLNGSLADINAALATLVYTAPAYATSDTLEINPWDQFGVSSTLTIPIAVQAVPTGGGAALNASPNGTTLTAASPPSLVDAAGNVFSLVPSANLGLQIAVNGTVDPVTSNVVLLEYLNGAIVQQNSYGNWYSEPGASGPWTQISDPNN